MTPGARVQTTVELLTALAEAPRPADAVASAFFRARRFMGSKDRAAVAEAFYTLLRRQARLEWWLARCQHPVDARALVLANALVAEGQTVAELAPLWSGARFAPALWSAAELRLARALEGHTLEHPAMPQAVVLECPSWAEAGLRAALGTELDAELRAMLGPAPLDLRVNSLKTDRPQAQAALRAAGVEAVPTPWSPWGLRVSGRPPLASLAPFRDGLVEIQDEGSQLVALLMDAQPGERVVDFCAGAGGKTLALAACMGNRGRIIACDVLDGRLMRAEERFRRAGAHNIETRALSGARDTWVKRHKGSFDRVLVDAPCSGTGTWRRNPDSRWRTLGPGLVELCRLQAEILASAARLVRPGGRLVYATCSLLREENEAQIENFIARNPGFSVLPVEQIWIGINNISSPCKDIYMRLTPYSHKTDGFFAAICQRETIQDVNKV